MERQRRDRVKSLMSDPLKLSQIDGFHRSDIACIRSEDTTNASS